jgi:hypothetical protein
VHDSRLVPLGYELPLYWPGSMGKLGESRVEFHVLLDGTCSASSP